MCALPGCWQDYCPEPRGYIPSRIGILGLSKVSFQQQRFTRHFYAGIWSSRRQVNNQRRIAYHGVCVLGYTRADNKSSGRVAVRAQHHHEGLEDRYNGTGLLWMTWMTTPKSQRDSAVAR